jgi:hypothetical protein
MGQRPRVAAVSGMVAGGGPPLVDDPQLARAAAVRLANHLGVVADGMEAAVSAFPSGTPGWTGLGASQVGGALAAHPARFRALAQACREAAASLSAHAERLAAACDLWRAADAAPVAAAPSLRLRAIGLADDSAREAARRLAGLAASAPPRPGRAARWLGAIGAWHGETVVGAAESFGALGGAVFRLSGVASNPLDPRTVGEMRSAGKGLAAVVRHPAGAVKAVTDWDTWRSNPVRAVGHLVPDLVGAAAGGAAAKGVSAGIGERRWAEAEATHARVISKVAEVADTATAAKAGLMAEAMRAPAAPGAHAWRGAEGLTLPAQRAATAQRFHALSLEGEARLTAVMTQVSRDAQADLVGLRTRCKSVESLFRKLATCGHGTSFEAMLTRANDTLRYTVVIDRTEYAQKVGQIGASLQRRGLHGLTIWNAWVDWKRYRGINTVWVDPIAGVTFEVQFHTSETWLITRITHPDYEKWRLPSTTGSEKRELGARIRYAYKQAAEPPGVGMWTTETYPPQPVFVAPPPPPDLTAPAVAAGAAAPQMAGANR